jgi:hypothetical protein
MRRLRRFLERAVFLGVAATQQGCCCPADDPAIEVDLERADPAIAALIDRCVANPDDCEALCYAALDAKFTDDVSYYLILDCEVTPRADGANVHVMYSDSSSCGRAPSDLRACDWSGVGDPLDRWLARAAYLEAASVVAFVQLAADLVRHGAPRDLVAAAIAAAADEVRHAALMRSLIRGRVTVPVPRVSSSRPASLRELAMLNATEGCARETAGAAVALWQATCARDPDLRAAFACIAPDELAHAELAWRIHAWALTQLDASAAAEIRDAHRAALARIGDDTADSSTRDVLGLPGPDELRALVAAIPMA